MKIRVSKEEILKELKHAIGIRWEVPDFVEFEGEVVGEKAKCIHGVEVDVHCAVCCRVDLGVCKKEGGTYGHSAVRVFDAPKTECCVHPHRNFTYGVECACPCHTPKSECLRCKNGCQIAVDGNGNGSCRCDCHTQKREENFCCEAIAYGSMSHNASCITRRPSKERVAELQKQGHLRPSKASIKKLEGEPVLEPLQDAFRKINELVEQVNLLTNQSN